MKIYTKKGDDGNSSLVAGQRVAKDDQRLEAYGTVDELNAWIGLLSEQIGGMAKNESGFLQKIQHDLFVIGSLLACEKVVEGVPTLAECKTLAIEEQIDNIQLQLQPLTQFILPSGAALISQTHIARTVCRRAERCVVGCKGFVLQKLDIIKYLNRLSDYLFVLSRLLAKNMGVEEVTWRKG
jgi:cob(I)alamin adenosyltransferase